MSDDLERMRAELEVLERYYDDNYCGPNKAIRTLKDKIAQLEAEAADPWREAKDTLRAWGGIRHKCKEREIGRFFDHLTAENDRLAARVAVVNPDYLNDFSPPKCEIAETRTVKYTEAGPLDPREVSVELDDVDDDPILAPARVLATAAIIYRTKGLPLSEGMCRKDSGDAKPYRLKRDDK